MFLVHLLINMHPCFIFLLHQGNPTVIQPQASFSNLLMSLLSKIHDLKLALEQFRPIDLSADEVERLAHTCTKLTAMLDHVAARSPQEPENSSIDGFETLLSIARHYGVRVADLRRHNPHLQHYDDAEPLPKNTPVKIKGPRRDRSGSLSSQPNSLPMQIAGGRRQTPPINSVGNGGRVLFDTIRSIARDQNVAIDALVSANRGVLDRFDVDEPLPQDLDIVIPKSAPPMQRTYVLTFAGETVRSVADTVAHCRPEELLLVNPQLGDIGLDSRLPEGTRVALPR